MNIENNSQQDNGEITRLKDFKLMEELKIALSVPSRLTELGEVTKKTFVKYVIFLSLLISVIIYLIPSIATVAGFGGFRSLFMEKMPAFKYENGTLTAERKFDMVVSGYHLYVDTSQSEVSPSSLPSNGMYLAFGSKTVSFIVVQKNAVNDFSNILYKINNKEMFVDGMDNASFAEASNTFYISSFMFTLFYALFMALKYILLAMIYTGILWVAYKVSIKNIYEFEACHISFYAQTIGILFVSINKALGYMIPSMLASIAGIFITFKLISYTLRVYREKNNTDSEEQGMFPGNNKWK
jgi:hypothetical protein